MPYSKIAFLLLGLTISLVLSEILLRVFWNPPHLDKKYARNDLDWISKNIKLNRFGYRDREFSFEKPKKTLRIYALGDSYTYGWMIGDADSSYPKLLEKMLLEKYGSGSFEVINASRAGFSFFEEANRLEQEGVLFSPDVVLIGINIFDLLSKEYFYSYSNFFPENLKIYQLTLGNLMRLKAARDMDREIKFTYSDRSPQIEKAREKIREMKKILSDFDSSLVMVVFPDYNPADPNSKVRYPMYEETIEKLGYQEGVEVVSLSKYFDQVGDKSKLVLNPVDPHPTALANQLAADGIFKEIDFTRLLSKPATDSRKRLAKLSLGSVIQDARAIVEIKTPGWVYFDRKYQDGVQKLTLPDIDDRRVPYLEDILKTAQIGRHVGWPGAKIEYNIPIQNGLNLAVADEIYGFKVVGVSQFTVYWREEGALRSLDLGLDQVDIKKEGGKIEFKISPGFTKDLDLVRIVFDVEISQFDMENMQVVALGRTEVIDPDSFKGGRIVSLPKYSVLGEGDNYIWCDGELTLSKIRYEGNKLSLSGGGCSLESKVEIPVMLENISADQSLPVVEYLY